MTPQQCLDVWRELLQVTRLIDAVHAVVPADASDAAAVWRAGLVALEQRRQVLAYVLSLEPQDLLEAVYARLVEELRADPAPSADMPTGARVH